MTDTTPEAPSRESQLRAARLRGLAAIVVTFALAGVVYSLFRSSFGLPAGACTSSSECGGLGSECLHAPTGAYCTHSCNHAADCDPGTHCDVPPWEKNATRTLCIHDTKKIGTN
ncbi:MAG: hypothetical protein ACRELY_14655 [Polyangiaceae bacterium]